MTASSRLGAADLGAASLSARDLGLVCPACRRVDAGALHLHALQACDLGLICPGCGRLHPVVDNTPIVLADLETWLQSQGPAVMRRRDLDAELDAFLARSAGGSLWRDDQRKAVYARSPRGPLHDWLTGVLAKIHSRRSLAPADTHRVLDLGCGLGAHQERSVLGLDLHWASLVAYPGPRVIADALNPPFMGASFDAVLAINLLDSCRNPSLLLQQADALLKPSGQLVISSPFHWQEDITPRHDWLLPRQVDAYLSTRGYRVERGEVSWQLNLTERTITTHRCVTWVAQR